MRLTLHDSDIKFAHVRTKNLIDATFVSVVILPHRRKMDSDVHNSGFGSQSKGPQRSWLALSDEQLSSWWLFTQISADETLIGAIATVRFSGTPFDQEHQ